MDERCEPNRPCPEASCTCEAKSEKGKIRTTQIKQVDNGYIVEVGCKTFVIGSMDRLLVLLTQYLSNPAEYERMFYADPSAFHA